MAQTGFGFHARVALIPIATGIALLFSGLTLTFLPSCISSGPIQCGPDYETIFDVLIAAGALLIALGAAMLARTVVAWTRVPRESPQ